MVNKALIVGGSNGIGLSMALTLSASCEYVYVVDKIQPDNALPENVKYIRCNLLDNEPDFFDRLDDINILVLTAGFGRIAPFESILRAEIFNSFMVNSISVAQILNYYYPKISGSRDFYCAVMGSIAGLVSSPLFALYGATKASICKLVESLNIELEKKGTTNRILNVSPGSIKGTKFNGADTNDLSSTAKLAGEIIERMFDRETLYIPDYESVYKNVLTKYRDDAHRFGLESFGYKSDGGRMSYKPQLLIGYLSGTFDLFHIGHLKLLERAKEYCDYLVVGVHKDASHKGKSTYIPFDERVAIVRSIKYVDRVIPSEPEDSEVYTKGIVKYDYLFVGSDYKNTLRFNKYEEYFADKGVRIVYFPYTKGTSSTQLRQYLDIQNHKK